MYLLLFPLPECELHEGGGFRLLPYRSPEHRAAHRVVEDAMDREKYEDGTHQLQKSLVVGSGRSGVPHCMTVSFLLWL